MINFIIFFVIIILLLFSKKLEIYILTVNDLKINFYLYYLIMKIIDEF